MFGTIGSIANHIVESFDVPSAISGNMVEIVDMARQHVANYTGKDIGSNSISGKYEPAILALSKADTLDYLNSQEGEGNLKIEDLSIGDSDLKSSSQAYRDMAERYLASLGRKISFTKSNIS